MMLGLIIYFLVGSNVGLILKYVVDPFFSKRYNEPGDMFPVPVPLLIITSMLFWPVGLIFTTVAYLHYEIKLYKREKRYRKLEEERIEKEIQNLRERIYALETR